SVRKCAGIDLHHASVETLLVCRQRVPRWKLLWPLSQPRVGGNNAKLDLSSKGLLPDFVPALVELPLIPRYPVFRGVMLGVRCTRRIIQEPRLGGRQRMLHTHPRDRLVRQITIEDVIGIS